MTSLCGISSTTSYQQKFTGTQPGDEQTDTRANNPKYDDRVHEISDNKLGSASTRVARKGIKYVWKNLVKKVKTFFKKNEQLIEDGKKVYDVANDAHNAVTIYETVNGDNTAPKYNYEA